MWRIESYDIWRPTTKEEKSIMRLYKKSQEIKCQNNRAENWFYYWYLKRLEKKRWIRFVRQAVRWWRIFDFWCDKLWVAIEVDWKYHEEDWKKKKDENNDRHALEVSQVLVIRIKDFDSYWAREAIKKVKSLDPWWIRRKNAWLSHWWNRQKQIDKYDKSIEEFVAELDYSKDLVSKKEKIINNRFINKRKYQLSDKENKSIQKRKDAINKLWL